jgi:hypothetical protein
MFAASHWWCASEWSGCVFLYEVILLRLLRTLKQALARCVLQRGQARPTLAQQGRRLSSQWSVGGRPLGSFDAGNPADVAQLSAALRAGSMRVNSLQVA